MNWRIVSFLAVLLGAATAIAAGKVRTWTNTDGRTMQAEFVREVDGDVTFLKNGKLIVVPLEKLSVEDQKVVQDLAAGKEPEDDPFTPTAERKTPVEEKPAELPAEKPAAEKPEANSDKPKKPVTIQTRTWTDRFGNKSSGKFVRVDGNDVVLSRGARVVTVAFGNLSEADQEYVRSVLTSQGKEDAIPSATAGGTGGAGNFPGGGGGVGGPGMAPLGPAGRPGLPGGPMMGPPGGMAGGMPGAPLGPGGMAGGPGRGPGIGAGPPPGMMPPLTTGPMGGAVGPGGIGGPIGTGGPMVGGFPGMADPMAAGGLRGTGEAAGPGGAMASGMMPPPGSMGGTGAIGGPGGMGGAGSFPGARMPGMETTSIPSLPSHSGIQVEEYFECSKCKAKLTKLEASGTTCPRCSTTWGFKQDEFGNKQMTNVLGDQYGKVGKMGAVIVIFVLLGTVVFIALFVGIIIAIVKATSGSARPPQQMPQQRYY